ncbi:hypothetical protein MMC30_006709 [Trapelia coarctata]|nr:hypothetical protein [Trapelia coarctata]
MLSQAEKVKRTRAGLPKVRTGCITCKIRHVKCDETKPACRRCTDTGRTCDGYPTKRRYLEASNENNTVVSNRKTTFPAALSIGVPGTVRERCNFDFFRFRTGHHLAQAMGLLSWHRLILQVSHSDPIVRHAAIALGSIGERLRIHNVLTLENQDANSCHLYARQQYQKAIELLRQRLSSHKEQSVLVALLSCFLFMCFEFLQGNDAGANLHLGSGLKIVRGIYDGTTPLEPHDASSTLGSLKDDILQVFAIMDTHATIWLGRKEYYLPEIPIVPLLDQRYLCPTSPKDFSSLEEAAISIISQINQIFYLQRSFPPAEKWGIADKAVLDAFTERERLRMQLEQWPDAVELLLVRLRESLSPKDLHLIGVMSMNCKLASIMLRTILETDEEALYTELEPEFVQIVALATSLLRSNSDLDKSERWSLPHDFPQYEPDGSACVFSFVVGLIAPLYYTAIKCRNRAIVQSAMCLLSSKPWREGAWDSAAMARIAQRKTHDLEAQGWYITCVEPVSLTTPTIPIPASNRNLLSAGSSYVYMKLNN